MKIRILFSNEKYKMIDYVFQMGNLIVYQVYILCQPISTFKN